MPGAGITTKSDVENASVPGMAAKRIQQPHKTGLLPEAFSIQRWFLILSFISGTYYDLSSLKTLEDIALHFVLNLKT